jgi:nucleoside-diphosphate-sugar epimerase
VDIRVGRIFNTYGPKMSTDDGRVVSNLICQALTDEPLTVYGSGSQSRSFCFVSDLIDGLIALFFKEAIHSPVNLGNPNPISMLELATTIKESVGSKSEIVFEDLPLDDPQVREPNIFLANSELNWFPKVDLLNGLDETIQYFKNEITSR